MKPRIVILAVNYHSDEASAVWLANLNRVLGPIRGEVAVVVVDNTVREHSENFFRQLREVDALVITLKAPRNLGYFGGAHWGWTQWQGGTGGHTPDWVVVSNVDVAFASDDFFARLLAARYPEATGVVGPSIISEARHGDWNPKMTNRPARRRMHAYKRLYQSSWLVNLYEQGARIKYALTTLRRGSTALNQATTAVVCREIYAPHGACILFAAEYFRRGGDLSYPGFLFGEEIFVAETARRLGVKVLYDPSLRMTSQDHVSTGRFRSKVMAGYMRDSAVLLADRYFP